MTKFARSIEAEPSRPHSLPRLFPRLFLVGGALLGLSTVAMGALAAHLPDHMLAPGGRMLLRSAVEMQSWHVPVLLACGLLLDRRETPGVPHRAAPVLRAAGLCFLLGIGCFCLALYALAFNGSAGLAHVAPVGGGILMLGWLLLAVGCAGAFGR